MSRWNLKINKVIICVGRIQTSVNECVCVCDSHECDLTICLSRIDCQLVWGAQCTGQVIRCKSATSTNLKRTLSRTLSSRRVKGDAHHSPWVVHLPTYRWRKGEYVRNLRCIWTKFLIQKQGKETRKVEPNVAFILSGQTHLLLFYSVTGPFLTNWTHIHKCPAKHVCYGWPFRAKKED